MKQNEIAAFMCLHDDNYHTTEQLNEYAADIIGAIDYLYLNISKCKNVEQVRTLIFDSAKFAPSTPFFFQNLYLLLFQKKSGPKMDQFIELYGIEQFKELLKRAVDNPLRIP